jgi:hypothetical protein
MLGNTNEHQGEHKQEPNDQCFRSLGQDEKFGKIMKPSMLLSKTDLPNRKQHMSSQKPIRGEKPAMGKVTRFGLA